MTNTDTYTMSYGSKAMFALGGYADDNDFGTLVRHSPHRVTFSQTSAQVFRLYQMIDKALGDAAIYGNKACGWSSNEVAAMNTIRTRLYRKFGYKSFAKDGTLALAYKASNATHYTGDPKDYRGEDWQPLPTDDKQAHLAEAKRLKEIARNARISQYAGNLSGDEALRAAQHGDIAHRFATRFDYCPEQARAEFAAGEMLGLRPRGMCWVSGGGWVGRD